MPRKAFIGSRRRACLAREQRLRLTIASLLGTPRWATAAFSRRPIEGPVLLACQVDGLRQLARRSVLPPPLPGVTPRRNTGHPDPSPAGEWMNYGSSGI